MRLLATLPADQAAPPRNAQSLGSYQTARSYDLRAPVPTTAAAALDRRRHAGVKGHDADGSKRTFDG